MNRYLSTDELSFAPPSLDGRLGDALVGEDVVHEFSSFGGYADCASQPDLTVVVAEPAAAAHSAPVATANPAPVGPTRSATIAGQRVQQSNVRSRQMGGVRVTNRFFVRRQFS